MPDKNPAADGWGGLGASHENGKPARRDAETRHAGEVDKRPSRNAPPPKTPEK